MSTASEQGREFSGPAILSYGFRPFFLAAAVWAAAALALWIAMLAGSLTLPSAFPPLDWHVHELLYGYLPAVVAGFLLTAIPNWTGRLPIRGVPLLLLFLVWLAGRAAVFASASIGVIATAAIDLAFLAVFAAAIARELVAGRNWRNLKVLGVVMLLFGGNAVFHFEAAETGVASGGFGMRIGLGAAVMLIMLVGGRVVPSFTRNWLAKRTRDNLPPGFSRLDLAAMASGALAIAGWIAVPERPETAAICLLASVMQGWRLARWGGARTRSEPLVLILHAGYAFVPIGFALVAVAILDPDLLLPTAALHAWTAGAIGVMTLAMMSRASLGHSGRALHAGPLLIAVYVAAIAAALLRIAAGFMPGQMLVLDAAGALWIAAFAGFAAMLWPMLALPRR